ncbi:MAG: hypothetical protein HY293_06730, partial [Planctomycetes bacterium]|nr:hypothetical protein [Planctomycetota bacterium]
MFKNLSVKAKLLGLVGLSAAGLAAFGIFSYDTVNTVKVHGPYYRSIVQGKDVIADVLPPPEYIIESFLVVLQMAEETDKGRLAAFAERGKKLKDEYDERHAFWNKDLAEGKLKELLIVQSYRPAMKFFEVRDTQFVPAILKGDQAAARTLAFGTLRELYDEHRVKIQDWDRRGSQDDVVSLATRRNQEDEQTAGDVIAGRMTFLAFLGGGVIVGVFLLSLVFVRQITVPLAAVTDAAENIARCNLKIDPLKYDSRDELG